MIPSVSNRSTVHVLCILFLFDSFLNFGLSFGTLIMLRINYDLSGFNISVYTMQLLYINNHFRIITIPIYLLYFNYSFSVFKSEQCCLFVLFSIICLMLLTFTLVFHLKFLLIIQETNF